MERIGIRELRQNASAYLRRVEAGETFEITDHGRPVALLQPYREMTLLERLVAEGRATRPKGSWKSITPAPLEPGEKLLSDIIIERRDDERW